MPETWANFGIDLHLDVAGSPGGSPRSGRLRAGLEAALRNAVQSGRLPPGTRLPASRALAVDLGLARNTVADAYGQLAAEGWFEARTGSGTWVTERPEAAAAPPSQASAAPAGPRYDLRAGAPAVSAFPRTQWSAAYRAALADAGDAMLDYPDPRGVPQLRTALASYLARARGVIARPEHIIICAGFAHGLALICQVLSDRGVRAIAHEAYGHLMYQRIAHAQSLMTVPLPMDADGAIPGDLSSDVGAVLLTPAHQYPLGMTLAAQRRTAFIRWASRCGGILIEDDYDGEFRYDRQPVGAMQALAPGHVIYAGTASKSLVPGLRLGWLVLPASLLEEVIAAKERSGFLNGSFDQLALAAFIGSGAYDRQIRQARLAYRRRRDRLIAELSAHAPAVRLTGIAAGLHAVAELPAGMAEQDVISQAAQHGVAVDELGRYAAAAHDRGPALVIGYGRPAEHAFTTAVVRLCAALGSADGLGQP